jgi:hypothetical protein
LMMLLTDQTDTSTAKKENSLFNRIFKRWF